MQFFKIKITFQNRNIIIEQYFYFGK